MPISPDLSAAGDTGRPHVIKDPAGELASRYSEIACSVVREVAKFQVSRQGGMSYDEENNTFIVQPPTGEGEEFYLHPANVRRNDQSAKSKNEWTGAPLLLPETIPEDIKPLALAGVGNYAVQISWPDGLTQIAT